MKNATAYNENTNYFVSIKWSEALLRSSLCLSLTFFTVEARECRFNDFNVIVYLRMTSRKELAFNLKFYSYITLLFSFERKIARA